MPAHRPMSRTAAALLLLLAGVLAACGGSVPIVTPEVAEGLAARADQVAALADAGDDCAALAELGALRGEADAAAEDGSLPPEAHEELVGGTDRIGAALACDDGDEDEDDEDDEDDDEASEGSGKSRGKGKAKGKSKDDG